MSSISPFQVTSECVNSLQGASSAEESLEALTEAAGSLLALLSETVDFTEGARLLAKWRTQLARVTHDILPPHLYNILAATYQLYLKTIIMNSN